MGGLGTKSHDIINFYYNKKDTLVCKGSLAYLPLYVFLVLSKSYSCQSYSSLARKIEFIYPNKMIMLLVTHSFKYTLNLFERYFLVKSHVVLHEDFV